MTIKQALKYFTDQLVAGGYFHAARETEIILTHFLKQNSAWLTANSQNQLSKETEENITQAIKERLQGKPLAYITGIQPFLDLDLISDKRALIPRPETEQLVELAKAKISERKIEAGHFLEVGTGSGAIAISLKKFFPKAKITATDVSAAALELAKENATGQQTDIEFVQSDLFKNLTRQPFDLIIANLPYVPTEKLAFSTKQILDWEPIVAIEAGQDGLKYIKPFLENVQPFLADRSVVLLEAWHTHGGEIKDLVAQLLPGYSAQIRPDLAKFDRFALIAN